MQTNVNVTSQCHVYFIYIEPLPDSILRCKAIVPSLSVYIKFYRPAMFLQYFTTVDAGNLGYKLSLVYTCMLLSGLG